MRHIAPLVFVAGALLTSAGSAQAAITGSVTAADGSPLAGVDITVRDTRGSSAGSSVKTNAAGAFAIEPTYSRATPPFTVTARLSDRCATDRLEATVGAAGDGVALAPITFPVRAFCAGFKPSDQPDATGLLLPDEGVVLAAPGGQIYLRTTVPYGATDIAVTLADGTVVGSASSASDTIGLTAPAGGYDGPLALRFTYDGAIATRSLGTLRSAPVPPVAPAAGALDLAAIVDVSGSMSGADPDFRRKDAVRLLIDLANSGDRLAGTGFDHEFHAIFGRTTITNAAKARLKRSANSRINNSGGTDYDVAFNEAYKALTADPLRPSTPKGAIFLTDGEHNGTYENSHLRFAYNGTGRSWPICVVQLGRGFSADATARLQRIARETGGTYVRTPTNTQLENLYFQCQGRTSGARTVLRRAATFRIGQTRSYRQRVAKRQRKATFFVSYVAGRYRLRLTQPGGRTYTKTAGKRVRLVRARTFSFFVVRQPKAGRWNLTITRLRTGRRTDRATTTITVERRATKRTKTKARRAQR